MTTSGELCLRVGSNPGKDLGHSKGRLYGVVQEGLWIAGLRGLDDRQGIGTSRWISGEGEEHWSVQLCWCRELLGHCSKVWSATKRPEAISPVRNEGL